MELPIAKWRIRILCLDDGSTDNSMAVVIWFQVKDWRIILYQNPHNLGTHRARIAAVRLTETPFLLFLDPDDELVGSGVSHALDIISTGRNDIVEYQCRMILPARNRSKPLCWKSPPLREASPDLYRRWFYKGKANCHLHRKIFRADLYKVAIETMPPHIRNRRILRYEDKLQYAFIVENMTRNFYFVRIIGEFRYTGLPDNSQSETYQSVNQSLADDAFVTDAIQTVFGKVAK
jgi:glycosyltransferase involved in cell wall biosynthesis